MNAHKLSDVEFEIEVARRLVKTSVSAKERGKDFNLTFQYLKNLLSQKVCAYSNEPFAGGIGPGMLTLERLDNNVGYIMGNVIAVKHRYNSLRADFNLDGLTKHVEVTKSRLKLEKSKPPVVIESNDNKSRRKIIELETAKIKSRQAVIAGLVSNDKVLSTEDVRLVLTLTERIEKAKILITNVQLCIDKSLRKDKTQMAYDNKAEIKRLENALISYDIIIKGLQRFENLSDLEILTLQKGLPLNPRA